MCHTRDTLLREDTEVGHILQWGAFTRPLGRVKLIPCAHLMIQMGISSEETPTYIFTSISSKFVSGF